MSGPGERIASKRMQRSIAAAFLAATAVVALHVWAGVGPSSLDYFLGGPFYDTVIIAAGLACMARAWHTSTERWAWVMIGAGVLSWGVGEILWTSYVVDNPDAPYPSPADIGYVGFYPLVFAGLVMLVRARFGEMDRELWMDALIAGLGTAAVGAVVIVDFVAEQATGTTLQKATTLSYPIGDITLIASVVAVITLTGLRPGRSLLLLFGGLLAMAGADITYTFEWTGSTAQPGEFTDPLYLLSASLLAAAAWAPAHGDARVLAGTDRRRQFVIPILFAGIVVVLLALDHFDPDSYLSLALRILTVMAIVARLVVSIRDNQRLLGKVRTDLLTGLGNRGELEVDLARACARATPAEPALLILFDLNGFKLYNDTYGHPAGDDLLARLGRRLREAVRPDGEAYRIGGDEFCVLMTGSFGSFEPSLAAATTALSEHGPGFTVDSSLGSVLIPADASDPGAAIQLADVRMYEQKDSGRVSAGSQVEEALLTTLAERQPDLGEHVHGVAQLSLRVGERLGLDSGELVILHRAAELHDIGKIAIPDAILDKPGPLDETERAFIERHTELGERIIAAAPSLAPVAKLVRSSHERFDGTGYPDGLAGEDIPLASRIIFACDAFSAMTSDRPYSDARAVPEALEELQFCAGGQFDPVVVDSLCAEVTAPSTAEADARDALRQPSWLARAAAARAVSPREP